MHQVVDACETVRYQLEGESFETVADLVTCYVSGGQSVSAASGARLLTPVHRRLPLSSYAARSASAAGLPTGRNGEKYAGTTHNCTRSTGQCDGRFPSYFVGRKHRPPKWLSSQRFCLTRHVLRNDLPLYRRQVESRVALRPSRRCPGVRAPSDTCEWRRRRRFRRTRCRDRRRIGWPSARPPVRPSRAATRWRWKRTSASASSRLRSLISTASRCPSGDD